MLPFKPESIERLKARLPQALDQIYDPFLCFNGFQELPGERRPHVFDFEEGLRLIICRQLRGSAPVLDISASATLKTRWDGQVGNHPLKRMAEKRLEDLGIKPLQFIGFSLQRGTPHWIVKESAHG